MFKRSCRPAEGSDSLPVLYRSPVIWLFRTAAKVLPLAPIAALRECGLIFGAIIGAVVFKEGFGTRRIVAAGLVAAGATAIAARAFY